MKAITGVVTGFVVLCATSALAALAVRRKVPTFGDGESAQFSVVAAMGGADFESTTEEFEEGRATAFMGGIQLDLVGATLTPGAYLTLRAVMGGIDVVVPAHWRVEVMGRTFMGGIGNLTDPDSPDADAPLLLVDAIAVMGGIEIHQADAT